MFSKVNPRAQSMQLFFRTLKNWALQVHVAKDNSILGDVVARKIIVINITGHQNIEVKVKRKFMKAFIYVPNYICFQPVSSFDE